MKYGTLFLLLILTISTGNINARRGGSSRGGGGSSRSSGRGSKSSSSPSHSSTSYSSPSSSFSHYNPTYSSAGKASSSSFIRQESAANQSPLSRSSGSSGYNSHLGSPLNNQPKPSAPVEKPAWSNHNFGSNAATGLNSDKPAWSNPHFNSNPPGERPAWSNPHFTGNTNSQNIPSPPGGHYPYPGFSTHHHAVGSGVASRNHGFNRTGSSYNTPVTNNKLQQSSSSNKTFNSGIGSSPYPSAPYPPFGSGSVAQSGVNKASAPYPVGSGSMPQPSTYKPSAPYPIGTGSMPQPGHTGNIGFSPSVTHPTHNNMNQPNLGHSNYNPSAYHPSYNPSIAQPAFNPHFAQPSYSHPTMGQPGGYYTQPVYQPAQPASGPVIVMAGQSGGGGGRGLGQIIAEAAVFSAVSTGVNRLLNPYPHHHYHDSVGTSAPSHTSTSITYNNYMNGQPVDPASLNNQNLPGVVSAGTNPATFPGSFNSVSSLPTASGTSLGVSNGVNTGSSSFGPQSAVYTPSGYSGTNIPASGIVSRVGSDNVTEPPVNPLNDSSLVIYGISNAEIWKLTEDIFKKQEYTPGDYIRLNYQSKTNSTKDVAPEPLFNIEKNAYEPPTVEAVRRLYSVYNSDSRVKENRTLERRQKENILLDTIMNTDVMDTTLKWLTSKLFIDPDDFEKKDTLNHIWFNLFDGSSSGFERVFVSETLHTNDGAVILGVQDWLTFAYLESDNRINYAGYVDKIELGKKASLVKLNYKMNDLVVSNTTILVGTLPELEMALYTICFYARPGIECPVSLGGTRFNIYTHLIPYFGKYLIAAAYPSI